MIEGRDARLIGWLLADAPALPDIGALVAGLAEQLMAEGVPVARATSHVRTLHPRFLAVMRLWRRGEGVREIRPERPDAGPDHTADYVTSTFQYVREREAWLDRRLDDGAVADFPMLADFRAQGLTHYVMAPLRFTDGMVNAASWATDAPDGFAPADLATLRAILPALRLVMELKAVRRVSTELLGAYVGVEPGEQILAGTIRRGDTKRVAAAILFADLRDFTGLAQSRTPEEVIAVLNTYFDRVVPPIRARGGEVLKFIGDGVLAMIRDDGHGRACAHALEAAREALRELDPLTRPDGLPLRAGIALHHGEVAYGNIGSRDRLDFTAVGRDVNLASRVSSLCAELDRPLLVTSPFAARAGAGFEPLGRFPLKGFAEPAMILAPHRGHRIEAGRSAPSR